MYYFYQNVSIQTCFYIFSEILPLPKQVICDYPALREDSDEIFK